MSGVAVAAAGGTSGSTTLATPDDSTTPRHAWVEQIMGMPVSIHVRGADAESPAVADAVTAAFRLLVEVDQMFSPYLPASAVSRMQRGELLLGTAPAPVREVHRLCVQALERTDGAFDAWGWRHPGQRIFDPTGLVKGWAIARAGEELAAVLGGGVPQGLAREVTGASWEEFTDPWAPGALIARDNNGLDWAINAGGDMLVHTSTGSPAGWRIGIEDPADRSQVLATVDVRDGAVATSGRAARGAHIVDPATGEPAVGVASATVIGPSIIWADVWATTACLRGADATWTEALHGTSGILVRDDGTIHRWANAA